MNDDYVQMQALPLSAVPKPWRFQSTVPARCGFCAEWIEGAPTHCKWCDEVFVPQPLIGLPVVRETPERVR